MATILCFSMPAYILISMPVQSLLPFIGGDKREGRKLYIFLNLIQIIKLLDLIQGLEKKTLLVSVEW